MRSRARLLLVGLLVTLGVTAPPVGLRAAATATELASAVQKRYAAITDFSATFEHTYRGGVLRTAITERGSASFKRPGLMRWVYESPERKEFVCDGVRIYSYIPDDRQVVVSRVPPDDAAPLPMLFLTGRGDLSRDFTVTLDGESTPTRATLRLVPRVSDADYAFMLLTIELPAHRVVGLTTVDLQGGRSAFTFTNLKENQGLTGKQFTFRIPRGVDVLTDDGAR